MSKTNTQSQIVTNRRSPNKKTNPHKTGTCSPEYNIYSDSDRDNDNGSCGDDSSTKKEGGSLE